MSELNVVESIIQKQRFDESCPFEYLSKGGQIAAGVEFEDLSTNVFAQALRSHGDGGPKVAGFIINPADYDSDNEICVVVDNTLGFGRPIVLDKEVKIGLMYTVSRRGMDYYRSICTEGGGTA